MQRKQSEVVKKKRPISGVSQLTKRSGFTSDLEIRSGITSDDPSSLNERGEEESGNLDNLDNINIEEKHLAVSFKQIEDEESYDFEAALREQDKEK